MTTTTTNTRDIVSQVDKVRPHIEDHDREREREREEDDRPDPAETSLLRKLLRKGLVEDGLRLPGRDDPSSPLYSVKSFEALHLKPALLKGVYAMGFNSPSKIQESALPILLADPPRNMIAQSQSGTGKTAAFVLAALSRVDPALPYPQALCLSPTRELALQTAEVASRMARFCPEIKLRLAVRGENLERGEKVTDHVVFGTPGKTLDWAIKFRAFDPQLLKAFALDEADVMIGRQGHQDQCIRIHRLVPRDCQMMFFSATYDEDVMEFAETIVRDPLVIRLLREEESLDNVAQYRMQCRTREDKYRAIADLYGAMPVGQAIVFCRTRATAAWLAKELAEDGHSVAVLSGELSVEERVRVLDRFREGLEKVIVATDVLARGIDVDQVTLVVNFDMPTLVRDGDGRSRPAADCETYLHRIGRTGRFGKIGAAVNLIDSPEASRICDDIRDRFGREIVPLDGDDLEKIAVRFD